MDGIRKHTVRLSAEVREQLETLTRNGSTSAKRIVHARILLLADQDHALGRYKDVEIANALGVHVNTVAKTRVKFCRQGATTAVDRKVRATPPVPAKIDGTLEAHLVAICCTPAPEGRCCWTMSLLADELMKRKLIVSIGRETVRMALKKMKFNLGKPNDSASPNATPRASSRKWKSCLTPTRFPKMTTSL